MLIIGGAALGTFLMANSMADVKHTAAASGRS
jgi:flagellar motor component MotA